MMLDINAAFSMDRLPPFARTLIMYVTRCGALLVPRVIPSLMLQWMELLAVKTSGVLVVTVCLSVIVPLRWMAYGVPGARGLHVLVPVELEFRAQSGTAATQLLDTEEDIA